MKSAIRLGAHSIEHGYIMDDECIELMLEARHLVRADARDQPSHARRRRPTSGRAPGSKQRNLAQSLCCRADAASDVHPSGFQKALNAGVKMALGSDIRPLKDAALLEMGLWVSDGATPWQTLLAATKHGAQSAAWATISARSKSASSPT